MRPHHHNFSFSCHCLFLERIREITLKNDNLIRQIVEAKPNIDNHSPERRLGGKAAEIMNRKISKKRMHSLSSMNIGVRVRENERIKE